MLANRTGPTAWSATPRSRLAMPEKILILAAEPTSQPRLRLGKEITTIKELVKTAKIPTN